MTSDSAQLSRRRFLQASVVGVAAGLAGCTTDSSTPSFEAGATLLQGGHLVMSPSCSCCHAYADILSAKDINLNIHQQESFLEEKQEAGIPKSMYSCHTIVTEDYVLEGHLPLESVEKLATERPDILGIAMPGMPAGSPGMGGVKTEDFVVYTVHSDGTTSEFHRV